MIQKFEIVRAPEAKKITALDLKRLLEHFRRDSEWGVMEYEKEDHLAEIAALKTENKRLEESLIYYVKESYKVETEAKRLRNALIEITDYPEERMTGEIAEEALREKP